MKNSVNKSILIFLAALAVCFGILFHNVIEKLVHDWYTDDNYSHGFLIIPVALYFVWERKNALKEASWKPSLWGLALVIGSAALVLVGTLGAELFLPRLAILGVIAGAVLFILGWNHFKILLLPICFLFLMIPIPAIIFNHIAFPLQLLASQFGEGILTLFQIPVLREGNVLQLANTTLEVAEACSGIRSLVSLLTLGIVYGYFFDSRNWARTTLTLGTIPIAIIANGIRVAGTGIAAYFFGEAAAQGFFHQFEGWVVFIAAFIMIFILHWIIRLIAPEHKKPVQEKNSAEI